MGTKNTLLPSYDQICNKYFRADGSWGLYDCVFEWCNPKTEDARAGLDEEMLPDDWQTVCAFHYLIPILICLVTHLFNLTLLHYQHSILFEGLRDSAGMKLTIMKILIKYHFQTKFEKKIPAQKVFSVVTSPGIQIFHMHSTNAFEREDVFWADQQMDPWIFII